MKKYINKLLISTKDCYLKFVYEFKYHSKNKPNITANNTRKQYGVYLHLIPNITFLCVNTNYKGNDYNHKCIALSVAWLMIVLTLEYSYKSKINFKLINPK